MKTNRFSKLLIVGVILLSACSSDGDENCFVGNIEHPNATNAEIDGLEYQASLMDCRVPRIQSFSVSNLKGGTVFGNQGTIIFVNPQSFEQEGIFIDDHVDIDLIEMYEVGEIIACQLSTNGVNLDGNIEPLFSEGMYYLDITYQGNPVTFLQPLRVFTPSPVIGVQQYLFASPSCPTVDCTVLWEEVISTVPVFEKPYIDADGTLILGYQSLVQDVGWKNVGRYNGDISTRTTVFNKAPNDFNKTNSNVFISYDTPSRAIGLFDEYSLDLQVFTERFSQIPIGVEADIIFVTVQGNQYHYGTKNGRVVQDFLTATLQTNSTDEIGLINALNNL